MSRLHEIDEAYDVHRVIPDWMRFSAAPIVRPVRRSPWLLHVPAESIQVMNTASDEISRTDQNGFSSAGKIARLLLKYQLRSAHTTAAELMEHDELRAALAKGVLPRSIPRSTRPIPLDVALGHAKEAGYLVSDLPPLPAVVADGRDKAFAAAQYLLTRRVSPPVTYLTSHFVVPDPLAKVKTAHVVQQLWIARDIHRPHGVRLLILEVEHELAGGGDDYRRDMLLPVHGYEIYRAPASWARVDPQRVVLDFLRAAAVPFFERLAPAVPGRTIKDYICAFCHGPMIRRSSGEGIVHHRDKFVHEACFNAAVNHGIFDY